MTDKDPFDEIQPSLLHVHVCIHCGHSRHRDEVGEGEINSGILHCPKCGFDGPLNVEIGNLPEA